MCFWNYNQSFLYYYGSTNQSNVVILLAMTIKRSYY